VTSIDKPHCLSVAVASYEKRRKLRPDDRILCLALEAEGIEAHPVVWDDDSVAWDTFDGCLLRSVSDYHLKYQRFLGWLSAVAEAIPVWNSAELAAWNSDKSYLRSFAMDGIPIVPTHWLEPGEQTDLVELLDANGWNEAVLKPTVGLGARKLFRTHREQASAQQHALNEMLAEGGVMVQPFLPSLEEHGETSLIFVDGTPSHVVRKRPAPGDFRVQGRLGGTVSTVEPTPAELTLGERIVSSLQDTPLFARVDTVMLAAGSPGLIELELIEPILYFEQRPQAAALIAKSIRRSLAMVAR
jgi:glutathione synthase/RimK-type ligase-like ATP-grasp enzyme